MMILAPTRDDIAGAFPHLEPAEIDAVMAALQSDDSEYEILAAIAGIIDQYEVGIQCIHDERVYPAITYVGTADVYDPTFAVMEDAESIVLASFDDIVRAHDIGTAGRFMRYELDARECSTHGMIQNVRRAVDDARGGDGADYLATFFRSSLAAFAWTTGYADGQSGDVEHYCQTAPWSEDDRLTMLAQCADFLTCEASLIVAADIGAAALGTDWILSRQRHGTGLWDRGLGTVGDALHAAAVHWGDPNDDLTSWLDWSDDMGDMD